MSKMLEVGVVGRAHELDTLAQAYGVERAFVDGCGVRRRASHDTVRAALAALGVPCQTPVEIARALQTRHRTRWTTRLEPVTVSWSGRLRLALHVRETEAACRVRCRLLLEDGGEHQWDERLDQLEPVASDVIEGHRWQRRSLEVPRSVPFGYHRLVVELSNTKVESLLIAAPAQTCRGAVGGAGLFLPLHALRSTGSWGVGDFSDLHGLLGWVESTELRAFATLPLLATDYDTEPCDPSPYLPVSRLFWNELFVDPRQIPEFDGCVEAQRLVESEPFRRRVASLETSRLVDYVAAAALKREVLELLVATLVRRDNTRHEEFRRWARDDALAEAYARFRSERDPIHSAGARRERVHAFRYHLYAQWVAQTQIEHLATRARDKGVGLWLDLPLGVRSDGFDATHYASLFASGVTMGAPPDQVFTGGQNWSAPPPHPEVARRHEYRYLRAVLGRHLSVAGRLRLDHIMGLHRLYWIPKGGLASDGVYVHYPADELYALVCLESWRHHTPVVGENLGTVPSYVTNRMRRHGMAGLHVAQFLVRPNNQAPLPRAESDEVACLNTHDTATFAGYLAATDIDDLEARCLLDAKSALDIRERRHASCAGLKRLPPLSPTANSAADETRQLLYASLGHLARSAAAWVLVNLEDLWLETRPHNVPGTGPERRNWRRRAAYALEEFSINAEVNATLRWVSSLRPCARGCEPRRPGSSTVG